MLEENQHLGIKFKSQYAHISWFRMIKVQVYSYSVLDTESSFLSN